MPPGGPLAITDLHACLIQVATFSNSSVAHSKAGWVSVHKTQSRPRPSGSHCMVLLRIAPCLNFVKISLVTYNSGLSSCMPINFLSRHVLTTSAFFCLCWPCAPLSGRTSSVEVVVISHIWCEILISKKPKQNKISCALLWAFSLCFLFTFKLGSLGVVVTVGGTSGS